MSFQVRGMRIQIFVPPSKLTFLSTKRDQVTGPLMRINKTPSTIFCIYHYVLGGTQQTLLDR